MTLATPLPRTLHDDDPDGSRRAVRTLAQAAEAVEAITGQRFTELPALVQDEHGCWITDPDGNYRWPRDMRFGCAVEWYGEEEYARRKAAGERP